MGNKGSKGDWWKKGSKVPEVDDKAVYVKDFADLPKDVQKMVVTIPRELMDAHFEQLLMVARFVTRRTLRKQQLVDDKIAEQKILEEEAKKKGEKLKMDKINRDELENDDVSISIQVSDADVDFLKKTQTNSGKTIQQMASELYDRDSNPKKLYKILKTAGRGGFARVFKAQDIQGKNKKVAIKKISNKTDDEKRSNVDEVYWLRTCVHDNIVKYVGAYEVANEVWIAMEFMEGGTLGEAVKSCIFEEGQISFVARECLKGLKFLHSQSIIHRDMKSANIMMTTEGSIKLIDFGLCCHISGHRKHMVGSPYWIPPEMINKEEHSFPADIWSTGICMFEMSYGHPPHKESPIKSMFMSSIGHPPQLEENDDEWSSEFKDFMKKMLDVNQKTRWTSSQLLEHPFIQRADTQESMKHIIEHIFIEKNLFEHSGLGSG